MTYSELKKELDNAPASWLPALFINIVRLCLKKDVFNTGAMEQLIQDQQEHQ